MDDVLRAEFPPYRDTPIQLAVAGDRAEAQEVARRAPPRSTAPTASARRSSSSGDLWVVQVVSSAPPLADESQDLVASSAPCPAAPS